MKKTNKQELFLQSVDSRFVAHEASLLLRAAELLDGTKKKGFFTWRKNTAPYVEFEETLKAIAKNNNEYEALKAFKEWYYDVYLAEKESDD
jgi:hypothetical protein